MPVGRKTPPATNSAMVIALLRGSLVRSSRRPRRPRSRPRETRVPWGPSPARSFAFLFASAMLTHRR